MEDDALRPEAVESGQGAKQIDRVVEGGIAGEHIELSPEGAFVFGGDNVIAVELVFFHGFAAHLAEDEPVVEGFFVALASHGGREQGDLAGDGADAAEKAHLVDQAAQVAPRPEGLAIVVHHHGHGRDTGLEEEFEDGLSLLRGLTFLDQSGGEIFEAEPEGCAGRLRGPEG